MAAANDASREVAFSSGLKINLHGLPEKITIDKSGANKAASKVSRLTLASISCCANANT